MSATSGGGGSVSEGSEAGESSQSTMSVGDFPSTSFQPGHGENVTKITLSEGAAAPATDVTGSKINLTLDERQQKDGVINMAFDYEEGVVRVSDGGGGGGGRGGGSGGGSGADFKSINGSEKKDKVPEAVNLELVNMVPYSNGNGTSYGVPVNGIPGIPVKKDSETVDMSTPYDEYFVPVNEHKKYMRGEKLYVTKDKRRPASWRRCLSWIVACTVISVVSIVAILAGTGVILSQEQNLVKEASIGRNFAGANLNPSVTQKSSVTPIPTGTKGFSSSPTTDMTYMYVPRSIESQLVIDNMDFDPALLDTNSSSYQKFATAMEDQLKMILFNEESLEFAASDVGLRVVNVSRDPFKVNYRIGWNYKRGVSNPPEPIKMEDVKRKLVESLAKNKGYIGEFHVDGERIKVENVINTCQIDNKGCSHICYYNYQTQLFTCTCPTHLLLDESGLNCVEWKESSEPDFLPVPELGHVTQHFHEVNGIHQHEGGIHEVEPSAEPAPQPTAEPMADGSHGNGKQHWSQSGTDVHSVTKDHETSAEMTVNSSSESEGHGVFSGVESKNTEPSPEPTPEPGFDSKDKEHSGHQDNAHGSHSWEEPSAEPTPEPGFDSKTQGHLEHHDGSDATISEQNEPSAEPTPESSPEHGIDEHSEHHDSAHGPHSAYFTPHSKEQEPSAEPTPEPNPDGKEHEPTAEPTAEPNPKSKDHAGVSHSGIHVYSEGKEHEPSAEPTPEPSPNFKDEHKVHASESYSGVFESEEREPLAEPTPERSPDSKDEHHDHEPSAEPEPTSEPSPDSNDDNPNHTSESLGVVNSKADESSPELTPGTYFTDDHQQHPSGSHSGVIDTEQHEPSAEPTPEPGPDTKNEHNDHASDSLSGEGGHLNSKEHEPSAEPEPTPEPSPDSVGELESDKSYSGVGVHLDNKEHDPSAEREPQPELGSDFKEHNSGHESASAKPAVENQDHDYSLIQTVGSDPQPTAEPIPETTISPEHSQGNQHSVPYLEQLLINDSNSHQAEHPVVRSHSDEDGNSHPDSTGHYVPLLKDVLVKEPSPDSSNQSNSDSATTHGGVIIEDIITNKSSPNEEQSPAHTEMPDHSIRKGDESKSEVTNLPTGVVANEHDKATEDPSVLDRDSNEPTTVKLNAHTVDPKSVVEGKTIIPKIIEYINLERNRSSDQASPVGSDLTTEHPQVASFGHSKSDGSSHETTTPEPKSFMVPVSIESGYILKEDERKSKLPGKTKSSTVEPNQNTSGADEKTEETEGERPKNIPSHNTKPGEIKTEHDTTIFSTEIKKDNEGKEAVEDPNKSEEEEGNSKEGIEIPQKKETNETIKTPEELSNNIKDESPDNEEFNTLLDEDFKNQENFSGEGRESVKYSNKPPKVEKKKVKDYFKGEKIEGDKKGGEGTVKPAVTTKDLYLQKHVNGNENAFDLDFGLQNEHTTDGEVTFGVPGVSSHPQGISNHDIKVLQTLAPDFRTETVAPGGWPQKASTDDKEGESKLEKEYSKFDKDYKYEKQKGAKKKDLKKKVGGKDGKNVELDDGRKYYSEVGSKDFDNAPEIPEATLYPGAIDDDDHEIGVRILSKAETEENSTEVPEAEAKNTTSSVKHENNVAEVTEHENNAAGVTESKTNVTEVTDHEINAPEVGIHQINYTGIAVQGNAPGVAGINNAAGVTEHSGIKGQYEEGKVRDKTFGESNVGITERPGINPVDGFTHQHGIGERANSHPRSDSTLTGSSSVDEPSATSPSTVYDGAIIANAYNKDQVPGTVFDGRFQHSVHGSVDGQTGNIQNSSLFVINKTTNLPRNFATGFQISNSSSTITTEDNTAAHPTIIINGQSGNLQDGHVQLRFSNGTGGILFNGSSVNPDDYSFNVSNNIATFPNGSLVHPTVVVRGQSGALQDGHESRFGSNTFYKFITTPGVFTSGHSINTSEVHKIDNKSLPGTVFDGHFNPQDGHYHMFTNSSGTYAYTNYTTPPTFVIKGNSGDFGNVTTYVLGNHMKTVFNLTGSQRPFQVKFDNTTVSGGENEEINLSFHGSNDSITYGHQISPAFFSNKTVYQVNNYFGYISKCAAGQFQCVNGTSKRGSACISNSSKCDSINDCSDGSDEQGCIETNCPGNFQCSDKTCLKRHLVCNGIVDCSDGSDEQECENWKCEFDEFQCPSGRCIPVVWQCDNKPDCDNHTDEHRCQTSCGNDEYLCPEGWCIPLTYKCNGVKECSNGEDEQLCYCSHEEFKCQTGGCVSKNQVCNDLDDCPDRSDEWGCVKLETESNLLKIRTPTGDYEPICADNWSSKHSDDVCASLGYFSSAPIENETNSSFTTDKSFYILKNDTTEPLNKKLLVNLRRSNGTCSSGKMVQVACQEFSCGSRSMTDSSIEARLMGGRSAIPGQWPSVALLYNIRNFHSCTANVLTPRWMLVSYNCLKMGNKNLNQQDWKMFGGSTVFEAEKENAETRNVVKIVPHPQVKFNQFLFSNDLALVELDEPLQFTTNVGAICLPLQEMQPRQICVTAGWGMNTPEDKSIIPQLQYLPVPTMNLTECNSTKHYSGFITEDKICAGYKAAEKSLCYNEEGAPLMCVNDRGDWELQGVLSYHSNCGKGSHPSIFSSIMPVKDWIKQTIGNNFERKVTPATKR